MPVNTRKSSGNLLMGAADSDVELTGQDSGPDRSAREGSSSSPIACQPPDSPGVPQPAAGAPSAASPAVYHAAPEASSGCQTGSSWLLGKAAGVVGADCTMAGDGGAVPAAERCPASSVASPTTTRTGTTRSRTRSSQTTTSDPFTGATNCSVRDDKIDSVLPTRASTVSVRA